MMDLWPFSETKLRTKFDTIVQNGHGCEVSVFSEQI